MYNRRELFGALARPAAAALAVAALDLTRARQALAAAARPGSPEEIAADEAFWFEIQQAFTMDRSIVNLNTVRSARHRAALCPQGQDPRALAAHGGAAGDGRQHPQV